MRRVPNPQPGSDGVVPDVVAGAEPCSEGNTGRRRGETGACCLVIVACGLAMSACSPTRDEQRDGGGPPACEAPERTVDQHARNAETLHMVDLADGGRPTVVGLGLVDPPFDFSRLSHGDPDGGIMAERRAQLAPSQDEVERRLRAIGATDITRMWIVNSMNARVELRHVPSMLCWPHVLGVGIAEGYYDVVTPPWDASLYGSSECPVVDGGCPAHCAPERASPVLRADDGGWCLGENRVVVCTTSLSSAPAASCGARPDGGTWVFNNWHTFQGEFAGWAPCTDDQPRSWSPCR